MPEKGKEPPRPPRIQEQDEPEVPGYIRHTGKYAAIGMIGVGLVAGVAFVGYDTIVSQDGGDKPKTPTPAETPQPGATAEGLTFGQILTRTQEEPRKKPAVLSNFDLVRVINGNYPGGLNTVEQITISIDGCAMPSGATTSERSISTVLFRNRRDRDAIFSDDDRKSFSTGFLTREHIEKTEAMRTKYLQRRAENAYIEIDPVPLSSTELRQISSELGPRVCGADKATVINPEVSAQRVLIDSDTLGGDSITKRLEDSVKTLFTLAGVVVGGALLYLVGSTLYRRRKQEKSKILAQNPELQHKIDEIEKDHR